jgi:hypothetical protein
MGKANKSGFQFIFLGVLLFWFSLSGCITRPAVFTISSGDRPAIESKEDKKNNKPFF